MSLARYEGAGICQAGMARLRRLRLPAWDMNETQSLCQWFVHSQENRGTENGNGSRSPHRTWRQRRGVAVARMSLLNTRRQLQFPKIDLNLAPRCQTRGWSRYLA